MSVFDMDISWILDAGQSCRFGATATQGKSNFRSVDLRQTAAEERETKEAAKKNEIRKVQ